MKVYNTLNTFFLVCGESGSGKSTIITKLKNEYGFKELLSYTTRPKRYQEETGHIFVSKEEFDLLNTKVAYTKYNGHEYCATLEQVDNSDLLTIDPLGIEYFIKNYSGKKKFKIVYIKVSEEERKIRMHARGDTEKDILERITLDKEVFKSMEKVADTVIANTEINECVSSLVEYIYSFKD